MLFKLKLLTSIFFASLLCLPLFSQEERKGVPNLRSFDEKSLRWGFLIGFNAADFKVINSGARTAENGYNARYADVLNVTPGLNVGVLANLRLMNSLDLRFSPGINFAQRSLSYIDEKGVVEEKPLQIKSTYLEFPLLVKYSAQRIHNFKPFLVAGPCVRYDLAKNKKDGVLLQGFDAYIEFGGGFDSYMNYFRLTTEFRMSIGLRNIIDKEGSIDPEAIYYTQAIDRITSRIFLLTFYFQ